MKKLIVLLLPLLFFACRKESGTISNTTNNNGGASNLGTTRPEPVYLWPLKQDNQWNYRSVIYQSNAIDTASTWDFSIKVSGPQYINSGVYFTYQTANDGEMVIGNVDTTAVVMGSIYGPYQVFYKRVTNQPEVLRSRTEVSPMGDAFTYTTIAYPGTATVDSFQNCIRTDDLVLDSSSDTLQRDVYYLKPGIGFVQSTRYGQIQGTGEMRRVSRQQLISYKLN